MKTGFATQTKEIMMRLAQNSEFDISVIGHNYFAQPLQYCKMLDGTEIKFKLYPGGRLPYAADLLPFYLKSIQPHIFWVLLDSFMLMGAPGLPFGWFLNTDLNPSKFIIYFPSDGEYFPRRCEEILKKAYKSIAMSKFAQKQIADLFNINAGYIPHAADITKYYPSELDRINGRNFYNIPHNFFVVGSVARNQGRKMIVTTIEMFAKFAKNKDDVLLFLHCDPEDPAAFIDLRDISRQEGCAHKVIFSGMKYFWGHSVEEMRMIYNLMDVHVLTTTGEGFGIPTIEAMACRVPTVMTDYTTAKEITDNGENGLLVKKAVEIYGTWNVKRAFVDTNHFVEQLDKLYYDRKLLNKLGEKAREKVVKEYSWEVVYPKWLKLFQEIAFQ